MPNGEDTRHHPNRRVSNVGTYMGNVGRTHMFSAESTGGDSTDSMQVTEQGGKSWGGVVGQKYEVPTNDIRHVRPVEDPENGLVWNKKNK